MSESFRGYYQKGDALVPSFFARNGQMAEDAVSRSPSPQNSPARSEGSVKKPSRSRSKSYSRSRSRSRSRHHKKKRSYTRSRSRSRSKHSRSPKRSRHSRSRSRERHSRDRHSSYRRERTRSRSPMSSRRRHDGNRDDPEPSKCLGVFGLSLYTQERDLRDVFGRYGDLEECNIVYDRQSGRSRGFAFVYYRSIDDAIEAKDRCTGLEIDGRRIRVDYSITRRAHTPTPGIYLGKPTSRSERYDDRGGYEDRYRGGGGSGGGYYERERRRSPSPYYSRRKRHSYSRSRSRSYSPRRSYY